MGVGLSETHNFWEHEREGEEKRKRGETEGSKTHLFVFEITVREISDKFYCHDDGFGEMGLEVGHIQIVLALTERVKQCLQLLQCACEGVSEGVCV